MENVIEVVAMKVEIPVLSVNMRKNIGSGILTRNTAIGNREATGMRGENFYQILLNPSRGHDPDRGIEKGGTIDIKFWKVLISEFFGDFFYEDFFEEEILNYSFCIKL